MGVAKFTATESLARSLSVVYFGCVRFDLSRRETARIQRLVALDCSRFKPG